MGETTATPIDTAMTRNAIVRMNKVIGMNTISINCWHGRTFYHNPDRDHVQTHHRLHNRRWRHRIRSNMITGEFPLHVFRLASPSLPVGGFSYSRGLEPAIDRGWVRAERGAQEWILGMLEHVYATLDGALFVRMMAALASDNRDAFVRSDMWLKASRESQELQLEDLRMGAALQHLSRDPERPVRIQRGADRPRTRWVILSAHCPQLHLHNVWRDPYDLALGLGCDIPEAGRDAGPDLQLRHRDLGDAYRPVRLQGVNTGTASRGDYTREQSAPLPGLA